MNAEQLERWINFAMRNVATHMLHQAFLAIRNTDFSFKIREKKHWFLTPSKKNWCAITF